MKRFRIPALLLAAALLLSLVPAVSLAAEEETHTLVLSSAQGADGAWAHTATLDGAAVTEYDYSWHCDPSVSHDEVKSAPAEWYEGEAPQGDPVYIAHDVCYYPTLPASSFVKKNYDGEQEWCYYYTDGAHDDFIFATLPVQGGSLPTQMMHTPEEAAQNPVLHITQPGTYRLEGTWHGQIWIDLGKSAATDPAAKVTLVLNGVDVTCTVAPALVFYQVYECDNAWETRTEYSHQMDTADAGARVVLADGTVNNFSGTNIYRMLKTEYKKNQEGKAVPVQKKQRKLDGAFYSFVSMNIDGEEEGTGALNVTAGFEGVDSELHLSFNGGSVNIFSQDDGVNVNEDGVSVVSFNGANVHILAGLGAEGDGVDSNGFLVVNGGTVISIANPRSDSGLDSDFGSYVNGGAVVALGSTMDWAEADDANESGQVTMNLRFTASQSSDEAIIVTDPAGKVVFAYDPDQDEVAGARVRGYQGAVLSFPGLKEGETYRVYVGGDVTGTDLAGVYDPATVTGFSAAAKLQSYAGTWESTGRPGFFPGQFGDGFDPAQLEDRFPGGQPGDGQLPPDPEGFDPSFGGFGGDPGFLPPDGQQPPDLDRPGTFDPAQLDGRFPGGDRGGKGDRPDDRDGRGGKDFDRFGGADRGQSSADPDRTSWFTMTGKVNNFNSVADAQDDGKPTAIPSTQTVEIDGERVEVPMYALLDENGNQTNYVRVRDLAVLLSDTAAGFDVDWDKTSGSVVLKGGAAYTGKTDDPVPYTGAMVYETCTDPTLVNGAEQSLDAIRFIYNNGGYTYYQLRDLGRALGFNVGWTKARGIFLETDKPYTGK